MRVIARKHLVAFAATHAASKASLDQWERIVRNSVWRSTADVQSSFPTAKALAGGRMRFKVGGNAFRLIVAFDFDRQIAFVKFIGTHSDYDRVDAHTVSRF